MVDWGGVGGVVWGAFGGPLWGLLGGHCGAFWGCLWGLLGGPGGPFCVVLRSAWVRHYVALLLGREDSGRRHPRDLVDGATMIGCRVREKRAERR